MKNLETGTDLKLISQKILSICDDNCGDSCRTQCYFYECTGVHKDSTDLNTANGKECGWGITLAGHKMNGSGKTQQGHLRTET